MNQQIKDIFHNNIRLLDWIDKAVYYFHVQNYDSALRITKKVINLLSASMEQILENIEYFNNGAEVINTEYILGILNNLLTAQENLDYILLSDLYEAQVNPFLFHLQGEIISKEEYEFDRITYQENLDALRCMDKEAAEAVEALSQSHELMEQGYCVEYSACGLLTLALYDGENKKFYMHSNNLISKEAFALANSWYREEKSRYIVYGLGLGYHIKELYHINKTIEIDVYESDIKVIWAAVAYFGWKELLADGHIRIIYDKDFHKLMKAISVMDDDTELVLHYPSIRNIKDKAIKEKLEDYFIQYSSVKNQRKLLNSNFTRNIKAYDKTVDDLKDSFMGRDLYIIAAGPSLDKNFQELKKVGSRGIILATGTVFRKLMNHGIIPDYVIVTDANARVYKQISGLEESKLPMLFLSTAYYRFAREYKGTKYIIFQSGYEKSEIMAAEHGFGLYQTGGSVSTTALDIGIQLGCKRIIFLGLDLAYTDNLVHAQETSRRDIQSTQGLIKVADLNGNEIYTTKVLNIYRKWIENRIKDIKEIEFIDATEGGAKINGMRIAKLSEVIEDSNPTER